MLLRSLTAALAIGFLLSPALSSQAWAKSSKAAKAAAKAKAKDAAKAKAKAKAHSKAKVEAKNVRAGIEAAKAAAEAMKAETAKHALNLARVARVKAIAESKADEAMKVAVERLRSKEDERHKLVTDHYGPLAAKAPAEAPAE